MKAIIAPAYPSPFQERHLPRPQIEPHDILVEVAAVAVNPVDLKRRKTVASRGQEFEILGWDAAGVVVATGQDATRFKVGDKVFYAGDVTRPGSYAQFQAVDERIVAKAPRMLTLEQASAMPLTALTAYEALFERLCVKWGRGHETQSLLIIGGAGGVGSLAIQLAKLAGLTVYATASRPESQRWCLDLGADKVLDHKDLLASAKDAALAEVDAIFNTQDTVAYWESMAALIKPEGRIVSIVETSAPLDLNVMFAKSVTFSWELMFTRSLFKGSAMAKQGEILRHVAELVDIGALKTTATESVGRITAANLERAHAALAERNAIGKVVLAGWE